MIDASAVNIHELIELTLDLKASDLFIKAGQRPMMKLNSLVKPLPGDWPIIDHPNAKRIVRGLFDDRMARDFDEYLEVDLGFNVGTKCRVRANCYMERGGYAVVCRVVPLKIMSLEELGLPPVLAEIIKHRQGLILVTGPTGCGKTTTLAALIDLINKERAGHIVTIEDPLEFLHPDQTCYVSQRELGVDTKNFGHALRAMLRQAPDVILIGEMRDPETMGVALQAGETGHLVFSTVHTASAYETMDRIVNMFPPHEKHHLCLRMAGALKAVITQKLVPRGDGSGRVAVNEILICTPTVSKLIEDGHFSDLYHAMNEGQFWGMQTMNQGLVRFVKAGVVDEETAIQYSGIPSELKQLLRR